MIKHAMQWTSVYDPGFSRRAISRLAAPLLVLSLGATVASAQDATWKPAPVSGDFNNDANWTPATAPSGIASFGASNTTSLTFSTSTTVDTFQFNPGAPAYSFGLNGHFLEFTGAGIVNNSSNAPTINAFGFLQFDNNATAGNAIINNTPGSTSFSGFSTAGTATITTSGGGLLSFTDFSNAGNATITTNANSLTQFFANSDGGTARLIANGSGIVDFSSTAGFDGINILSTGSIAGAGQYFLGNNLVHVGGNGDSTTVSGVISACGPTGNECTAASGTSGGSLFKEGSGTLTLSGVNTYTGSTVVGGGTLKIAGAGTLGAATAQLQVVTGTLDLGGTTQVTGTLSTFGGAIVNGALNSTNYVLGGGFISASLTGTGAVTQDGVGTTTLAAANTYTGATSVNSGTLEAAHASAGTIDALSNGTITINSGGALRSSVDGALGNAITFNDGSFGTLSAAAGTTLTVTGGIFLNPDSVTTFGSPADTGTLLVDPAGISASNSASIVVGGGTLRAGSFQLGTALGATQSTTVNVGATLDLNDFSAAIHNLGGAGSVATGTLANTNVSLVVDPATSSEFSGVISGAGTVTVAGGGTMILSGNNTYGAGTSIMAATTLQIGNGGVAGSISGNVLDGGTLVFNRSNTTTFAGIISDFSGDGPASAGSVVQNGTGTTILTANNTYTAGTTINAGTLQLGNGGTTGSIVGNVLNNATFAINRSNAVGFGGVISGTGAFQQLGTGTTTLSAVQTYQGATTINAGVLALTGTASIAASSGVAANAKFDISGLSGGTSISNLSGGSAGSVSLGNNTLSVTNAAGTFAGAISGNGGLVKQGSGLFTLSGPNDYTGATTVAGGNLRVDGSVASSVTVQSGATLSGIGSVGGAVTIQSGGTLSAGQSPGTITLGSLNLNSGSTSVFELGSPGVVGGATNDLVNVTGNLTLGGTLSVNAPSAGYYRLFNYGTLTPSNFAAITGSTNGNPQVLTNVPNQVNLSIAAAGQRIQFWDGADQTGNGVVNGGTGTWNATNTNWTGAPGQATINDQWRSSVGVFSGTAGTVTVAGAQAFDTLQFSTTGYLLNAGAGGQLQLSGLSGTGTINTDGGVTATINTPIVNGSSQSLTKVGTGTLVLTGNNSYTGGTTISAGTLQLGNGGASGSLVGNVVNNAILAINRSDAVVLSGVISGSGQFQQLGTGTTTFTAANTYTGATTVAQGTLTLAGAGNIASSSGVIANGAFDVSGVTGAGTSIKTLSGAGSVALGAKTLTLTNASGNFTGSIGGTGGVTLAGGSATLSGVNTYTGATTISGGTLALAGAGSIASSSGVVDAGTFDLSGTGSGASIKTLSGSGTVALGAQTLTLTNASDNFAGVIGGSGGFTLAGGTQTLSGQNTYTGLTTITNGTLTLAGGAGLKSPVLNNATFNLNGGTLGDLLTNNGVVNVNGGSANTGVINNAQFNVTGNFGSTGSFTNSAGAALAIGLGTLDFISVDNSGIVTTAAGSQLRALNLSNRAGGTITIAAGAMAFSPNSGVGGLTNAGTFINNGVAQVDVNSNSGTITNGPGANWNGRFEVNSGLITNNGTWIAHIVVPDSLTTNSGTFVNNGTYSSNANTHASFFSFRNSGTLTNTGTFNSSLNNVVGGIVTTTGTMGGNLANSGTVNANGGAINGTITNNAGGIFNVGGMVASNSTFTNAATATLAIGSSGAYTLEGLLSNSGAVTVAGGGQLIATTGGITNNAGGTITVAAGGTVKDDLNNAGVVTNNGAYVANVASNTGTITNNGVWTGNIVSNAGTIANNLSWTGNVSTAGTFSNNGALNGTATVSGGTFTGAGTVTNLNVSGGTFAPGNGTPGTSMTVTGNLAFQSGAMYLVTLNPTTSTFTNVGGTASLNGTAAAVYLTGNYVSKKYTILTAAGGVSGTFGSLVNSNVPANFTSTLSYDANHAYVDLVLNFTPKPAAPNFGSGLNINQQNVANTLVNFFNSSGGIPLAFGSLTPAGLTQVSGELGTGIIQTAIKADDLFLNLLLDPAIAGRAGGFATTPVASRFADDDEALAYAARRKAAPAERDAYAMATKAPYLAPQPVGRWSLWGAAYGGAARIDGNAVVGSHDLAARVWGVVGGADYKLNPDALVGFALAGGGTNYSLSDALGSGRSDLFQAGVFGRQNIGAAYLSAALAYGWHDVTTNRTVALPAGDVLQARFRGETFSARFEGGYRFATSWAGVAPYVAAQAISFHLPGYAEQTLSGPGTFALNYAGQTTTATRTELGVRPDWSWAMQDGIFTLRGRAAWAHDYNNDRAVTAVFQTLPGAAFVVNGARANPDAALVSAGAEMKWLNGFSLAATFEGEFSGNTTGYAGKGVARYSW
jgi:fibronectin-binding autotransporter adhesin